MLELAEGGQLFKKIIVKTKLNEAEAKLDFLQIALAIKYLHLLKICQRDLKPENMLLCSSDESLLLVKITVMSLSKLVSMAMPLRGCAPLTGMNKRRTKS